jgi:hypothetical protein
MDRACSTGEKRNEYRVSIGQPEGKEQRGIPRCRWEDDIKMDLRGIGRDDMDWIDFAQDNGVSKVLDSSLGRDPGSID